MRQLGIVPGIAACLCAASAAWAEPTPLRQLQFVRLAAPEVGPITHVTAEPTGRIWMLSEHMDVLVAEGGAVRKLRSGSWAFEPGTAGDRQYFAAVRIAAAAGTLAIGGAHLSALGSNFAALATLSLDGRLRWWTSMLPGKRSLRATAEAGAIATSTDCIEWSSGARTYVGFLHPGPDEVVLLDSPSRIWIANQDSIRHFDGWAWTTQAADAAPRALWFDGMDTLWVLSEAGLALERGPNRTTIVLPEGFEATAMKGTQPNRVWFFGPEYLAVWNGVTIVPLRCPMHQIADLWQTEGGNTYFVGASTEQGATAVFMLPKNEIGGTP
jgi:hypothetical protein